MPSPAAPVASSPREIRVFISSTFRDMQEEREELAKQIRPQLRRLCESRGVTWGEVNLRWGVADEAKAELKVLPAVPGGNRALVCYEPAGQACSKRWGAAWSKSSLNCVRLRQSFSSE
jgi:hypothetical protein